MSGTVLTNEFSVCLMCDDPSAKLTTSLRQKLPESPYRDDFPHLTLLRGISAKSEIRDAELAKEINAFLDVNSLLTLSMPISKITNRPSYIYGLTSLLLLKVPKSFRQARRTFVQKLRASGYKVELLERLTYFPHVTLRLGVPVKNAHISQTERKTFISQKIKFDRVVIFRLVIQDSKRVMRQVPLNPSTNSPAKV